MKYQVNVCGPFKRLKNNNSSACRNKKILNLPSVKKAHKSLPMDRSESSLQKYDGSNYYQWHYRFIFWYAVGPIIRIKGKK